MAVMDESAASTGGKIHIAWSGGAGDCIIIGAYSASKRKAIVEHADQTTGKVGFDGIDTCEVYLASQKFGGEAPAADGLVVRVINGLLARKANIVAIYTTSRLAIRDDGTVLADFDSKDLADESTRDVNETMQGWGMGKKTE